MAERGRRVYCTLCGNVVNAADRFCGACGAEVSPDAADAPPMQQASPSLAPSTHSRSLTPFVIIGFGLALVLVLWLGSVAALSLIRGQAEPSGDAADRGKTPVVTADKTQPEEKTEETTGPPPTNEGVGSADAIHAAHAELQAFYVQTYHLGK